MTVSMNMQEDDVQVPVTELLGALLDMEGSDLHLTAGAPPTVSVHGDLERVEGYPALTPRGVSSLEDSTSVLELIPESR